jgi:hypothetical protein
MDILAWTDCVRSSAATAGKISYMGDFQKNEDFSFSENNLNIK